MLTVAAFYHFAPLDAPARQAALARLACGAGVRGTILLAGEGVNGTIAGPTDGVARVLAHIRAWPGFAAMTAKFSTAEAPPFARLKVRLKAEIVSLGVPGVDARVTGTRVAPADWDAVLADPDTVVIDTRNDYEVAIGSFPGALDPRIAAFSDFPAWWAAQGAALAGRRVAMFCTGGIRCEKASAWLLGQGVAQVAQLDGGILAYLEQRPDGGAWAGECFVFDGRVALGPGLSPGRHVLCHACGRPVGPAGQADPAYVAGVSCPACVADYAPEDRARFAERQRQIALARVRGGSHLGPQG